MIHFELVSPAGTKFEGDVYEVLVPAQGGAIAVFQDHMPLISAVSPGVLSIRQKAGDKDDEMHNFAVNGGIMEVDGKNLKFIADDISAPDEISEEQAKAALARAEELVASAGSRVALAEAHRMLSHSHAQFNLASSKRRHHR